MRAQQRVEWVIVVGASKNLTACTPLARTHEHLSAGALRLHDGWRRSGLPASPMPCTRGLNRLAHLARTSPAPRPHIRPAHSPRTSGPHIRPAHSPRPSGPFTDARAHPAPNRAARRCSTATPASAAHLAWLARMQGRRGGCAHQPGAGAHHGAAGVCSAGPTGCSAWHPGGAAGQCGGRRGAGGLGAWSDGRWRPGRGHGAAIGGLGGGCGGRSAVHRR